MKHPDEFVQPNRRTFGEDPFGYSASAWQKFGLASTLAGSDFDISKPPTKEDLKNPVLWLTHAHAMAESARIVLAKPQTLRRCRCR
jgi:hypothetical protein